jgi:hypothetical protein
MRRFPSVDAVLCSDEARDAIALHGRAVITLAVRATLTELRAEGGMGLCLRL